VRWGRHYLNRTTPSRRRRCPEDSRWTAARASGPRPAARAATAGAFDTGSPGRVLAGAASSTGWGQRSRAWHRVGVGSVAVAVAVVAVDVAAAAAAGRSSASAGVNAVGVVDVADAGGVDSDGRVPHGLVRRRAPYSQDAWPWRLMMANGVCWYRWVGGGGEGAMTRGNKEDSKQRCTDGGTRTSGRRRAGQVVGPASVQVGTRGGWRDGMGWAGLGWAKRARGDQTVARRVGQTARGASVLCWAQSECAANCY